MFFSILNVLLGIHAFATHVVGTELTYRFLGESQYQITYTLYRDCSGTPAPFATNLLIKSASRSLFMQYMLVREGTGQPVSNACNGSTTCEGGNVAGVEKYVYSAIVTLTERCPDWKFSVSDCCRSAAISSLVDPANQGIYTEAFLDNSSGNNSSPHSTSVLMSSVCRGQQASLNLSCTDDDGDSVVYRLSPALSGEGVEVAYSPGYSFDRPVTGSEIVRLDPVSGELTFTPAANEIALFHIRMTEYRDGVLIGETMRDIQLNILSCSNALPAIQSADVDQGVVSVCAGSLLFMDIGSTDPDEDQTLTLSSNTLINGASITNIAGHRPRLSFRWIPETADIRTAPYRLDVTVKDNACPVIGSRTYSLLIYVKQPVNAQVITYPTKCEGSAEGSAEVITNSGEALTSIWSTGTRGNYQGGLPSGWYAVTVSNGACSLTLPVEIAYLHSKPEAAIKGETMICASSEIELQATGGILYSWENGHSGSNIKVDNQGVYTVTVEDQNGCKSTVSHQVQIAECGSESIALSSHGSYFSIHLNGFSYKSRITVYNASGQLISSFSTDKSDEIIDQHVSSGGLYVIRVETLGRTFIEKIVI